LGSCASLHPAVEPLSLDEAYLDVTDNLWANRSRANVRRNSKRHSRTTESQSLSGRPRQQFLAKIASGWKKPDGLTVDRARAGRGVSFTSCRSRRSRAWGRHAKKLRAIGIERLLDVRAAEDEPLHRRWEVSRLG